MVGRIFFGETENPDPRQRFVLADDAFELVDEKVRDAFRPAVERAAERVGATRHVQVSPTFLPDWFGNFRIIQASEIWANHGEWITAAKPSFGRGISERMEWASRVEADDVRRARQRHAEIRARLDDLLDADEVLCLPSSPRAAPRKNTPTDDLEVRFRHQAMCLLCISGLGGLPQVSLPLATLGGGLPGSGSPNLARRRQRRDAPRPRSAGEAEKTPEPKTADRNLRLEARASGVALVAWVRDCPDHETGRNAVRGPCSCLGQSGFGHVLPCA